MKLQSDVVELVHATVMRMVLEPGSAPGDVPDPGLNFAASVDATLNVIEASYYAVPRADRPAYMRERAREMLAWCERVRAPDVLTKRVRLWVARVERDGNPRSSSDR